MLVAVMLCFLKCQHDLVINRKYPEEIILSAATMQTQLLGRNRALYDKKCRKNMCIDEFG